MLEQEIDTDVEMVGDRPKAPVELRTAAIAEVNFAQRLITAIAAPYEQATNVMWRGDVWSESFERGAWDGIERRPNRIKVNRDHNKSRTVGKAMKFFPSREEGLVTELRIAQTSLGDETLALADERCVGLSVGFAALPADQIIDRANRSRKVRRAFLDHISFVEDPAYPGAEVLEVRENEIVIPDDDELLITPLMDEFMHDPRFVALLKHAKA
jgi:HK97 family phage prohead protease